MDVTYADYFGFQELPFLSLRDIHYYYANPMFDRAARELREGIADRTGLLLLTGKAGTGKSTLLRKLQVDLEASFEVLTLQYTSLSWREFLDMSCDALDIIAGSKSESEKRELLQSTFRTRARAGKATILLIDDALNLENEVLIRLVGLVYCDETGELLAPIVFASTEKFASRLARSEYSELDARICVRATLAPLALEEVGKFISSRLEAVGYKGSELFTDDAVERIAKSSGGIPQLINTTCGAALLAAYEKGRRRVTADVVEQVRSDWREFEGVHAEKRPRGFDPGRLWSKRASFLRTGLSRVKRAWGDLHISTVFARAPLLARDGMQRLPRHADGSKSPDSGDFIIPLRKSDTANSSPSRPRMRQLRWSWISGLAVLALVFWLYANDPNDPVPTRTNTTALDEPTPPQEEVPPSDQAHETAEQSVDGVAESTQIAEEENPASSARTERIRSELGTALEELGTTWQELLAMFSREVAQQEAMWAQRAKLLDRTQLETSKVVMSLAKLEALSADTLAELDGQFSTPLDGAVSEENDAGSATVTSTERAPADETTVKASLEEKTLEGPQPELTRRESLATAYTDDTPTQSVVAPAAMTTIAAGEFAPAEHQGVAAKLQDSRWDSTTKTPQASAPLVASTALAQPASKEIPTRPEENWSMAVVEKAAIEAQSEPVYSEPSGEPAQPPTVMQPDGGADAATRESQKQGADSILYEVRSGDTLTRVARMHGVTLAELVEWNRMHQSDLLYPGQELRVSRPQEDPAPTVAASQLGEEDLTAGAASRVALPPEPAEPFLSGLPATDETETGNASVEQDAVVYEVRTGDTLSEIARSHDVKVAQLALWNDMRLSDTLYAGQKLRVMLTEENEVVTITASRALDDGADTSEVEAERQTDKLSEHSALDMQLLEASARGDIPVVVDLLGQGARVDASDAVGDTALFKAAVAGHDGVVSTLLSHGANTNLANSVGETALMVAAWNGHVRIVHALLRHGVEFNAKNNDGWSALLYGAISGHWGSVRSLIEHGANVDAVTSSGRSPLLAAVWNGHVMVARELVNARADINVEDSDGWTALMAAAYTGDVEAVELLLAHGAQIDATAKNRRRALTVARQQGNEPVVALLQAGYP